MKNLKLFLYFFSGFVLISILHVNVIGEVIISLFKFTEEPSPEIHLDSIFKAIMIIILFIYFEVTSNIELLKDIGVFSKKLVLYIWIIIVVLLDVGYTFYR